MDYPIWNVPILGGAMVIAIVAIVHVFIAHFAVGAAIFNALTETFSLKSDNSTLRLFLRDNTRLIILLPFTAGLVTALASCFTFVLVSPETTALLVHLFFWPLATAWLFLLVAIGAGYLYHYSWDRLPHRRHCLIGWIYAGATFLAMMILNALLAFMLTPGASLDTTVSPVSFNLWQGLNNPTFWPSLILRTLGSLALAALFAMVLVNATRKYHQTQRDLVVRQAGKFLTPLILMAPAGLWFFAQAPESAVFYLKGGAIAIFLLAIFCLVAYALIACYSYFAIVLRKTSVNLETALLLTALALIATGSGEFVREGMRKPYLIWGHIYSNGLLKENLPTLEEELTQMKKTEATALKFSPWAVRPQDADLTDEQFFNLDIHDLGKERYDYPGKIIRGRWLYDAQCLRCHTTTGYNAAAPLVHEWSPKLINHTIMHLAEIKSSMPPFLGAIRARDHLSHYLHSLSGTCNRCHENVNQHGNLLDPEKQIINLPKEDWKDTP